MRRPARNEDGTVLLSTLLVLSLMSAVALGLLATVRGSVRTAQYLGETAQADLYADGARDFAALQVARLAELDPPARNAALLAQAPIVLPFDGGSITATVRDGSHCLRLSGLSAGSGAANANERLRLAALIEALGAAPGEAQRLAAAAADYADADSEILPGGAEDGVYLFRDPPHRTANVPFTSIWELRAVDGMTEAVFQALRPHLCIGAPNVPSRFNLNTADRRHLPVLAAMLSESDAPYQDAARLLEARPMGGFDDIQEARLVLARSEPDDGPADPAEEDGASDDPLVIEADRVEVEAVIRFGEAERVRVFVFEGLADGRPRLTHRDWGRHALRPRLTVDAQDTQP